MNWMTRNQKIGLDGEEWARRQLIARGYSVHQPNNYFEPCKDLVINSVLCCEVKISMPGQRRIRLKSGYAFYPRWKWDVRAISSEDRIVILIAASEHVNHAFICPSALFVDRVTVEITNRPDQYKGYLSKQLNNWAVVDYLLEERYKDAQQLDLFTQYREVREAV